MSGRCGGAAVAPEHDEFAQAWCRAAGLLGMCPETLRLWQRRQGWDIGRDQAERLMRLAGVRGVRTSKRVFTARSDKTATLPGNVVNRRFTAPAHTRFWVCDVTYVATWSVFTYVAFVTVLCSRASSGGTSQRV